MGAQLRRSQSALRNPKLLYNHGLFSERTLTFGARRLSFKLKKTRKARACSCLLLAWVGVRQNPPSGLSPSHHPAPPPRCAPTGAAQPGPKELGADATGAREGVTRRSLPWARPARLGRPPALGRKVGQFLKGARWLSTNPPVSFSFRTAAAWYATLRVRLSAPRAT